MLDRVTAKASIERATPKIIISIPVTMFLFDMQNKMVGLVEERVVIQIAHYMATVMYPKFNRVKSCCLMFFNR